MHSYHSIQRYYPIARHNKVQSRLDGGDIRETARAAVAALSKCGLKSCLFGSAACAIYGTNNREPNVCTLPPFTLSQFAIMEWNQDVDIIVLSESKLKPEEIKEHIITWDNRFYLLMNGRNTSKLLWFKLSNYKKCKVDILVPGYLSIPKIPINKISYIEPFQDIPVVPLMVLLLLKLKGWTDHLDDQRQYMRDKFEVYEEDMKELLNLVVQGRRAHLDDEKWLPKWFVGKMRERVQGYIKKWPNSGEKWKTVGF